MGRVQLCRQTNAMMSTHVAFFSVWFESSVTFQGGLKIRKGGSRTRGEIVSVGFGCVLGGVLEGSLLVSNLGTLLCSFPPCNWMGQHTHD